MAKKTVQERAQAYMNGSGAACFFCGHDDTTGSQLDVGSGYVYQNVFCPKCGREWVDIYSICSVGYSRGRSQKWIEIERKMGG